MKKTILSIFLSITALSSFAESHDRLLWPVHNDWSYQIRGSVNLGGASPIPLPREIRKIESFDPHLNLAIEGLVTRWITPEWGIQTGVKFEQKGMKTGASVKDYGMEIIQDGGRVAGRWTGKVSTDYTTSFFTIPLQGVYRINDRWKVNAGVYMSIALNKTFEGYVYEGYLREGDPTGEKVTFEGDAQAPYDFSTNLRTFQWGAQIGGSWLATNHFAVDANLTWGLNDIFESSFKTVTFKLSPIYLNLGFSYYF